MMFFPLKMVVNTVDGYFVGASYKLKKVFQSLYFILFFSGIQLTISGQPVVNFTLPDSSCVGAQINITNLTTGGSTFYWNFCSGNANSNPTGINIGNPGNLLDIPTYITLAQDGNNFYSFINNQFVSGVVRYYHGTTFGHNPVSWTDLGTFGVLTDSVEGIQVDNDNGNWYGFVCNNNKLIRLNFGTSLANTPTATILGPFSGLVMLHGLVVIKQNTTWLAFATCSIGDAFIRFNFGDRLDDIPVMTNFGNLGLMTGPGAINIVQENSFWYAFIMDNMVNIVRLTFGNSLLNVPSGANLGNPGGLDMGCGLSILRDCDSTSGYFTNYLTIGELGKLTFSGGIMGTITGQVLGDIGNLNKPQSFSQIFRQNDTLFSYITNRGSSTLTRLTFPPCTNSSIPSSTQYNPPPFSYNQPGTYNVHLTVNEGLPDQVDLCKSIVIGPVPTVNLGPDRNICLGQSTTLDAGEGFTTYLWSTGATSRTITVSTAGTYLVTVTHAGCSTSDSTIVIVSTTTPPRSIDTIICFGEKYFADGAIRSISGTYFDTLQISKGCDSIIIIHLTVKPKIPINLGGNKTICPGEKITLHATLSGATYTWQDSSTDSIFVVSEPGIYWVHFIYNNCSFGDTAIITECPGELWFPSAFTPNGDGVNDLFRPKGFNITNFKMMIYSRWGQLLFETSDIETGWDGRLKGVLCPANTYTFIATYELTESPGKTKKQQGSFILLR